jgi:hypothetical protein
MIRIDNISKSEQPSHSFHRGIGRAPEPRREDRPCRAERCRQDHAVPHDHRAGAPDEGQVSVERNDSVGYFSQDVGEMAGRSAVAEVMDGVGPVSEVAAELRTWKPRWSDPDRLDEMDDASSNALWRSAGALRGTRRLRAGEPGARGAGRPELQPGDDGRRRRQAFRRLEDARGACPHPSDAAGRHAARRAEQPSRPRKPDLAGAVPEGL